MGGLALLLLFGLGPGSALAQQTEQTPPPPPEQTAPAPTPMPEATQQAGPACADCHDQAKAFTANPHARGEVKKGEAVPNAVCETCHGDGTAHMESGEKDKITVPSGLKGSNETCLMCHDLSTDRRSHRTGVHANTEAVNCLSCHGIHSNTPRLLKKPEVAVCSSCHSTQVASFRNKPYGHKLGRGGMTCTSCHEPHSRPGKENLRRTAAGEIACMNCHTEKRGPHVFEHSATQTGDQCMNCHEVHGSNNPMNLRRTNVAQLCLECHSPITGTLGSQPPSFHNVSNPRYQRCTTCHVAVHGSNSNPQLLK